MPSTYSPLKIQLMATGENNTTWGDVTNLNLGTAIEEAIVGSADVTFASGDVTLTLTDTNASQTARNMRLRCTGTTGGARNLIVPSIEKPYIVKNDCADSVTVKTAAGTGIAVPAGKTMWVYSDGTNVVDAVTHLSSLTLGTDLSVADGGTGASTFTANGVLYGNGASALQVTAAGTTGQVLVGNTGSAPSWATLTSSAVTSISFGSTGLTPSTPTQGAVTVAGTLGVTNGGTGTATQFTAGSVVFAGASGVYTQDNANLFWDNANDRLGIGTATPSAKLSVVGTAKIGEGAASNTSKLMVNTVSGVAAGIQLFQDGNESWVIENPASTTALTFANSGTERMRITGAGNVGIGTTSPGFTLEVSGTQRIAKAGAGYEASMLSFSTISETGAIYRMGMASGGNFIIGRSDTATTNITLDSSGNVGIGTNAPAYKLDVAGQFRTYQSVAASYASSLFENTNASGYTQLILSVGSGGANGQSTVSYAPGILFAIGPVANDTTTPIVFRTNNATERMRITSAGNVGIGTTSPNAQLHVSFSPPVSVPALGSGAGALALGPAANYGMLLGTISDGSGYIQQQRFDSTSTVYPLALQPNGGNVGIGTTAPNAKLTVAGAITSFQTGITDQFIVTPQTAGSGVLMLAVNEANNAYRQMTIDGSPVVINTAGSERMRIDSSGNVGIGTSGPGTRLDVWTPNGTATTVRWAQTGVTNYDWRIPASTDAFTLNYGGTTERMRITSTGDVGIGTSSPAGKLDLYTGTSGVATNLVVGNLSTAFVVGVDSSNNCQLRTAQSVSINFLTAGLERMRIDSSGNVGIGTSSPTALLTVSNGGAAGYEVNPTGGVGGGATVATYNRNTSAYTSLTTYSSTMTWYANGSTRAMDLDSSGNLGIGTSSPSSKLTVFDGTSNTVATLTSSASALALLRFTHTTDGGVYFGSSGTSAVTYTNGSERMRIDSSGNVGIGTSSPGYKLDVNGAVQATDYRVPAASVFYLTGDEWRFRTTGGTERARIDSSGNLLVGTTSANGTLSVVGDQISVGSAGGSSSLGIQIKGTTLSAIPAAQVQSYIATGNSSMGVAGDLLIAPRTDVAANIRFITGTSPAERMRITDAGNLQLGTASLATNATNGFPYIPTCAGTPTGTPTAITGYAPMVVDSTNNKLYVYVGGAWQAMN